MPDEPFSIAQVTPYGWEQHHEVNRFVERLSDELCRRGHRVVVVAPSESRELIKEVRSSVEKKQVTPLDGARLISSIAATLFGYDEFILREISPETFLAATPSRR